MVFLSSFIAIHYRGISGLSLPRLTRANLITGVNGVGKTALIEAIWLFTGRYNPTLVWNPNVQRSRDIFLDPVARLSGKVLELHGVEQGSEHQLSMTFDQLSGTADALTQERLQSPTQLPVAGRVNAYVDGELAKGQMTGTQMTPWGLVTHEIPVPPAPRPNCIIESGQFQLAIPIAAADLEYMQRYSDIVREGRKHELTRALNLILPGVQDLEMLSDRAGVSYLSAVTKTGDQLPLNDLGGGVVRLFRLFLDFAASQNGLLLVDEIENGVHHSALTEIWNRARTWMHDWDVQLVATTHSAECIDAAMDAFADNPEDLSIHKLFEDDETGQIRAVTYVGEALEGARELNWEVR